MAIKQTNLKGECQTVKSSDLVPPQLTAHNHNLKTTGLI
jgi:hypothetical protein